MALSNANEYVQGLYGAQFPVMASALLLPPTIKAYDPTTWVLDDKISAASEYSYDSYGFGTYYDDVHGDLRATNLLLTNSLLKRNSVVDRVVASGSATVDLIGMIGQKSSNHKLDYKVPTKRGARSENTSLDTPMHVGTGGSITMFAEKHDQLFSREEAPITPRT